MEAQQFHLKWNNHSLNTLSSFQHLLDSNTLVDVTLTSSNGKNMSAHRIVLAACSEYFYRLFKTLPEKHPVIVFKDASEEILKDLLLFIYRGEVEVQETHLNDFLKFADTLQVKGLTQPDRASENNIQGGMMPPQHQGHTPSHEAMTHGSKASSLNNNFNSPTKGQPIPMVKKPRKNPQTLPASFLPSLVPSHIPADLAKSYITSLSKFSQSLTLPTEPVETDFLTQLSSPNLYQALHRKYPETNPALLKSMPFLKKMFGDNIDQFALAAAAMGFPPQTHMLDDEGDALSEHHSPTPPVMDESIEAADRNRHGAASPEDSDVPRPMSSGFESINSNLTGHKKSPLRGPSDKNSPISKNKAGGRGSRLERMIAAEYKIMSEYSEPNTTEVLPAMTPELMKSRRTHSLQLAIGEILHNHASVQSAATKYHIPRETLRRHYQRYLKVMGINNTRSPSCDDSMADSNASATNNNSKSTDGNNQTAPNDTPPGYSSLMDIGQAYGIWNADVDGAGFKSSSSKKRSRRSSIVTDDKDGMDEDQDQDIDEEDDDNEPLSPGGPGDEEKDNAEASSKVSSVLMEMST